jgi:hypothetical protein
MRTRSTSYAAQGPAPFGTVWLGVEVRGSPIGDFATNLGPVPEAAATSELADAADLRVAAVARDAGAEIGRALAADPKLCARCARTYMRAALGSLEDGRKIHAATPADAVRYRAVQAALWHSVKAAQREIAKINSELATGELGPAASDNPWAHIYEMTGAGWPMKTGQWSEYKACACGAPGSGDQPETMVGCAPDGRCGCGCGKADR